MAVQGGTKKYGLVLKTNTASDAVGSRLKPVVFDNDGESDSEEEEKAHSKFGKTNSTVLRRQDEIHIRKALEEDKSVFQYDEVYDDIQKAKDKVSQCNKKLDTDKKPKYIPNLIKAAEIRNREYEARIERQQQTERQKEGSKFADKDVFVTKAYREKMERIHEYEKEQQRREHIENMMDVTKQRDLSGFYRHFLNDTYNTGDVSTAESAAIKQEPEDTEASSTANVQVKKEIPSSEDQQQSSPRDAKDKRTIYSDSSSNDGHKAAPDKHVMKPGLKIRKPAHAAASKEVTLVTERKQYKRRREHLSSSSDEDTESAKHHHHRHRSSSEESIGEAYSKHKASEKKFAPTKQLRHLQRSPSPEVEVTKASSSSVANSRPSDVKKASHKRRGSSRSVSPSNAESPAPTSDSKHDGPVKKIVPKKLSPEERLVRLREFFAHRNDENSVDELRQRYFQRKAERESVTPA